MDKRDLAAIVSIRTGIGQRDVENVIATTFDVIRESMLDNTRVLLRGFGIFGMRPYKEQIFRHHTTGESYRKVARRVPCYWPAISFVRTVRSESPMLPVETPE